MHGWVDIYRGWWNNICLPAIQFTEEPVALLWTTVLGMIHLVSILLVRLRLYPPTPQNCTSIYQPIDQGIITTLKTLYKREMLSSFAVAYDKFDELQELAKKV